MEYKTCELQFSKTWGLSYLTDDFELNPLEKYYCNNSNFTYIILTLSY